MTTLTTTGDLTGPIAAAMSAVRSFGAGLIARFAGISRGPVSGAPGGRLTAAAAAKRTNVWDYVIKRADAKRAPADFSCDRNRCPAVNCRGREHLTPEERYACFLLVDPGMQMKRLRREAGPDTAAAAAEAEAARTRAEEIKARQRTQAIADFQGRMAALDRVEERRLERRWRQGSRPVRPRGLLTPFMYYYFW